MKRIKLLLAALSILSSVLAQKKPLDHAVYDGWQSVGEKKLSNDGKYVAFTVDVQEGDGRLCVSSTDGSYKRDFARGYNATFSQDGRFLVFKVKAPYADTRQARIKKKKADDMPKDSLFILDLSFSSRHQEKVALTVVR